MADAFATATDLATRLGRAVWTVPVELAQVNVLLSDASEHLRGIIGWQVYPTAEVTLTGRRAPGTWLELPGAPVAAISAVTSDGVTLDASTYELQDNAVYRSAGWFGLLEVTYTVGYETPPADLVSWTCVLASQALDTAVERGTIGPGQKRSQSIDNYSDSYDTTEDSAPFLLPARVEDALRARYGGGVHVTGSRL